MTRSTLIALAVLAFAAAPAARRHEHLQRHHRQRLEHDTNWSQGHVPTSGEDVSISVSGKNPSLSADGVADSIAIPGENILPS